MTPSECEACLAWYHEGAHTAYELTMGPPHLKHVERELAEAKADWKAAALREANAVKEIVSIEAQLAEKDARIRELEGVVTHTRAFFTMIHLDDIRRDLFLKACTLDERAEAALARSEEGT